MVNPDKFEQTAVALLLTFVVMRETHAPTLKKTIYGKPSDSESQSDQEKSLSSELRQALSRPLKLLSKSPVVPLCCLQIFLVIGILNVFLTEMSRIYQALYNMSSAQSGSIYFGLGLGFVIASVLFGTTNDRIMHMLARRNKDETRPEFRLPAAILGMPVVVIGLLWYGWTLKFKTPWIVPTIGSGIAGIGITTVQVCSTISYKRILYIKISCSSQSRPTALTHSTTSQRLHSPLSRWQGL